MSINPPPIPSMSFKTIFDSSSPENTDAKGFNSGKRAAFATDLEFFQRRGSSLLQ
jgi:hypothetical protein